MITLSYFFFNIQGYLTRDHFDWCYINLHRIKLMFWGKAFITVLEGINFNEKTPLPKRFHHKALHNQYLH